MLNGLQSPFLLYLMSLLCFKNKALAKSLRCLVKSCISSQEIHDLLQNYIKY